MALEIHETVAVRCARADGFRFSASHDVRTTQTDSTPNQDQRRITVTTSDTALTFQNVSSTGVILITNLEALGGNFIKYGPDVSSALVPLCRINPQETHKIRLFTGVTFRWQADTASVEVQLEVLED